MPFILFLSVSVVGWVLALMWWTFVAYVVAFAVLAAVLAVLVAAALAAYDAAYLAEVTVVAPTASES